MRIYDLYSKRQKRLKGEEPDVYSYDQLPQKLRVQIVHIIRDAIGTNIPYGEQYAEKVYETINNILCREYGLFRLIDDSNLPKESIFNFFLRCKTVEEALDVVEVTMRAIELYVRDAYYQHMTTTKITPDDAIKELNARFAESGIGYQYESGQIIRVDSQFTHSEAVKPALQLLSDKIYKGANEEFLKSHEHYRNHRNKECLADGLKSLESVMKAICDKHKWSYKQTDTAKALLDICFEKDLVPKYMQSQFSSLRSLLESGVPTIRNKLGGHGQGAQLVSVPDSITRYALNLTAANILLLGELEKKLK